MRHAVDDTVDEQEEQLLTVVLLTSLKHGVHLLNICSLVLETRKFEVGWKRRYASGVRRGGDGVNLSDSPEQAGGRQVHVSR